MIVSINNNNNIIMYTSHNTHTNERAIQLKIENNGRDGVHHYLHHMTNVHGCNLLIYFEI